MEIEAHAKINLTLEVLGRRPDGYHEVRTVLQTIDLPDRLHFNPAPGITVSCAVGGLGGRDNLVWRAADALRRATGTDKGADISLDKRIPIAAGLGGGSSDAAATLRALNNLWELGLDQGELASIGASLGADVPFFLKGGTAFAAGRGEALTPLPHVGPAWMVLMVPQPDKTGSGTSIGHKTAHLYSMLTPEHYTDGSRTDGLVDSINDGRLCSELLYNVFATVAPVAFPGFDEARGALAEAVKGPAHLSGTGPALYSLVSCKEHGDGVVDSLKARGLMAYCVSTWHPPD